MNTIISRWVSYAPYVLAVLRIVVGIMFFFVGTMKLFAFPTEMLPGAGTASLLSLIGLAGILEFVGGALMTLGLFVRPVAFVLSGEMAVAYFVGHAAQGFWPMLNGGQMAILYCFIFLYFSTVGASAWSLDALRSKN